LQKEEKVMDDYTKGLFAAQETSGKTQGNYLQLEKTTFKDMKQRGLINPTISWELAMRYQPIYDQVADVYLKDIMDTHKISSVEDAALWSWRPGWYQKYQGDPTKIPDTVKGVYGKSAKQIMIQRSQALTKYLTEKNGTTNATPTGS
jgi:hypothetical protein